MALFIHIRSPRFELCELDHGKVFLFPSIRTIVFQGKSEIAYYHMSKTAY